MLHGIDPERIPGRRPSQARTPGLAAGALEDQQGTSRSQHAPLVFLVGPPGSGKSTLGRRVCAELGLRFLDLVDDGSTVAALQEIVRTQGADVVTLPWVLARDARWLEFCRKSGETVALWAHPLDMQERSGRAESLFTPVKRLRTGSFGRRGTGCSEYRHLERTVEHVLLLVGLTEEIASQQLYALIGDLRSSEELSPAEREGLLGWCRDWRDDFNADARACEILVDAMARFTMALRARGTSPRAMSGIYGDLNAAGFLVMCCDAPKAKDVLGSIDNGPPEYEYQRRISDSPRALVRFRSTWDAFGTFLRDSAMLGGGGATAATGRST